jgi:hypothetical protein
MKNAAGTEACAGVPSLVLSGRVLRALCWANRARYAFSCPSTECVEACSGEWSWSVGGFVWDTLWYTTHPCSWRVCSWPRGAVLWLVVGTKPAAASSRLQCGPTFRLALWAVGLSVDAFMGCGHDMIDPPQCISDCLSLQSTIVPQRKA